MKSYRFKHEGRKTYNKKGFANKKEALQHESEMRMKLAKPGYEVTSVKVSKQFLAQYLIDWLERYVKNNLRPNTYNGYKVNICKHIIPVIGNITLNDLHGRHLDDLYSELLDNGLAMNTVKYIHRTLSVALDEPKSSGIFKRSSSTKLYHKSLIMSRQIHNEPFPLKDIFRPPSLTEQ